MESATHREEGDLRVGRRGGSRDYDAFISYSHAADNRLAPALQRGLHKLARPANLRSALDVFRDGTSLAAGPDLWATIEVALRRSRYFVLLASPDAARSPWVRREVEFWRQHRERDTFLIVLTDGWIHWDEARGDFDWGRTTALPEQLRGWFAREPLWVDLSWARTETQLTLDNAGFRNDVGTLAAAIHGVPKDDLDSEDVRQQVRRRWTRRGVVTALAALAALALVAAGFAVVQRDNAIDEATVARARQLAALAVSNIDSRLDLAQLQAVAAYRTHPDARTRAALFETVAASPHLVRVVPMGVRATVVSGAPGRDVAVVGTADGRLLRWDLDTGVTTQAALGSGPVVEIATDLTGSRIVASDGDRVFLWNGEDGARPTGLDVHRPAPAGFGKYLAVSPSGNTIAVIHGVTFEEAQLVLLDGATGRERRRADIPAGRRAIGLVDDTTANVIGDGPVATVSRMSLSTVEIEPEGVWLQVPADGFACCGYSFDASFTAWAKGGTTHVSPDNPAHPYSAPDEFFPVSMPIAEPDRFAVGADGTEVAAAGGGALYAARFDGNAPVAPTRLLGTGNVDAVAFVGRDRQLVSASGTDLIHWDMSQASRLAAGPTMHATSAPEAGDRPFLDVSPDGAHLAVSGWGRENLVVADFGVAPPTRDQVAKPADDGLPVWSRDGTRLLLLTPSGAHARTPDGGFTEVWREPNRNKPVAARTSADGQRVVVVSDHGEVDVRAFGDGAVLSSAPGAPQPADGSGGRRAISADLSRVATVRADGEVWLTETASGRQHRLPGTAASAVAYVEDRLLLARADNSLEVWDSAGERLLRTIAADAGYTSVMIGIEGQRLVARLTAVGTVKLWNVDTGDQVGSVTLPDSRADLNTALAASADGRELLAATGNGTITRWHLHPDAWIDAACASAGRDLTPEEWTSAVGTEAPEVIACER
ncbi:TIR domain-containing protein [Saccharothrix saharensis]|uniref:TIR domain-containing protein n=1 Tax=Saccharothrix saharensis TaxID=571190 RepID=A0A543J4M0_9PSEU|nr:TIR domain-containing protein [Saccharothrix saharensis]TQM77769.1 TIR domain-containing protein [Saccharothrix saharensis]